MSRSLKLNLHEIHWYSYIDEEYEWLRDFVFSPTETWNKALAKGGEYLLFLSFLLLGKATWIQISRYFQFTLIKLSIYILFQMIESKTGF